MERSCLGILCPYLGIPNRGAGDKQLLLLALFIQVVFYDIGVIYGVAYIPLLKPAFFNRFFSVRSCLELMLAGTNTLHLEAVF